MVYGCQVWGQNHSLHLERIFKLQNRALRIINFEERHADSNPLYIDNKILKLQDFVRLQTACLSMIICTTHYQNASTIITSNSIVSK